MLMMWVAEWPLASVTAAGDPSGSTNPIVDYHLIYALMAIICALTPPGGPGAGRRWESTALVKRVPWLRWILVAYALLLISQRSPAGPGAA
jgi:thiosulfate dehydrogenase (quinone) large subunit